MNELQTAMAWLAFGQKVIEGGTAAWNAIKAAAAASGIETDNAALDAVIIDAERRKEIAKRDAAGG